MTTRVVRALLALAILFSISHFTYFEAHAEEQEYRAFGSLGMALVPVDPNQAPPGPSGIHSWIAFGEWRGENATQGGIGSKFDIEHAAYVDTEAGTLRLEGSLDGFLRDHLTFNPLGKLHAEFSMTWTGMDYGVDSFTGLEIFGIGRTATGLGNIRLTSPDGSVTFGSGDVLNLTVTEKYLLPSSATSQAIFGPFIDPAANGGAMCIYIGPRFEPGNLFFTGTDGAGYNSWIMSNGGNIVVNGIEMNPPGGDFHGDFVPKGPCEDEGFGPDEQPDECGVCGGTGPDQCGVCGGDGTSCLPVCADVDILSEQFTIDATALELRLIVRRAAKQLRRRVSTKQAKRQAREAIQQSKDLYQDVWTGVWTFESIMLSCTDSIFCVQTSNTPTLLEIETNSDALLALVRSTVRKTRAGTGNRRIGRKHIRLARQEREIIDLEIAAIPDAAASCQLPQ